MELRFTSAVFLQSTRFDVFLVDSGQEELGRQAVEPGDAAPEVESSTNVVSLPVSTRLFANATLDTRMLTPNGDGRNDVLVVSVDLVNVLEQRPLRMLVFDLSGRLLGEIEGKGLAGHWDLIWDGRDSSGRLVVPGLYLLELHVEGDAQGGEGAMGGVGSLLGRFVSCFRRRGISVALYWFSELSIRGATKETAG